MLEATCTMTTKLHRAALRYAEDGWPVFFLKPKDKRPLTEHGFKDATTDLRQINEWWSKYPDANIGIPTGEVTGIVVLDLDGPEGERGLVELGAAMPTLTSITRKGRHMFFQHPGGSIRNRPRIREDLDVRGDGGYVVAPPSIHPDGHVYKWDEENFMGWGTAPAPMSETLLKALRNGNDKPPVVAPETIPEGTRDDTLFRLGCAMREKGLELPELEAALLAANEKRCKPPLYDSVVTDKARRICETYPAGLVRRYKNRERDSDMSSRACIAATDLGNARRLVNLHGQNIRYVARLGGWQYHDGKRWASDETGEVVRMAKDAVRAMLGDAQGIEDDTERRKLVRWQERSESEARISSMINLGSTEPEISATPANFDSDLMLLNVSNGTIDLETGELRSHCRSDYITKLASVQFGEQAKAPQFENFLDQIFAGNANLIEFIQKAIGYALTGRTSEQVLFILFGTGANGKSVLVEIIRALLGDYAMQAAFSTFLRQQGDGIPNDLARLKGARFVSANEAEKGRRLAEAVVKQIAGGDRITARFLRQEFFEFDPHFKLFLATNHKPKVGTGHAIWRRIRLVPFNVTIPADQQDRNLLEKLKGELSGILNWALAGCLAWQREGLGYPEEVREATEGYQREMDTVAAFLDDSCIETPNGAVGAAQFYESYKSWHELSGESRTSRLTQREFSDQLSDLGFEKRRSGANGARQWHGLELLSTDRLTGTDRESY